MAENSSGSIKSVVKAISILELLNRAGRPQRVTDIAKELGLSQSVASRIISTLGRAGYVETDPETGQIHLGYGLCVLGNAAMGRRTLDQIALPFLAELSNEFVDWMSLSRLYKGKVVMMRGGATPSLARDIHITLVLPVHATAPGKVLLAWRRDEEVRETLELNNMDPFTKQTIMTQEAFLQELEVVRTNGYAVDDRELYSDLRHVAVPIRDHSGNVVAALSSGGKESRVVGEYRDELIQAISNSALHISRKLGYNAQAA